MSDPALTRAWALARSQVCPCGSGRLVRPLSGRRSPSRRVWTLVRLGCEACGIVAFEVVRMRTASGLVWADVVAKARPKLPPPPPLP